MRHTKNLLTIGLALLLALTGTAAAQGAHGGFDGNAASDHASASSEAFTNTETRYADADASAATDEASAALDTDANVADVESAKSGGFFGWLEVRLDVLVGKLSGIFGKLGVNAPETDAAAEAYVSTDGVDLDATLLGTDFDASAAGKADDKTWQAAALAKGKVEEVKGKLPSLG